MEKKNSKYEALLISEKQEPGRRWAKRAARICKWLDSKLPFILHSEQPCGRLQIERQLKSRNSFDQDCWILGCDDVSAVEDLLKVLAIESCWPNHHFVPDDPLKYLLLSANNSAYEWVPLWLQSKYCVQCSPRELFEMADSGCSVGEFVQFVFERASEMKAPGNDARNSPDRE